MARSRSARIRVARFKSHLPSDCTCPPEDAKAERTVLYRLVRADALDQLLVSWRELNPGRSLPPGWEECQTCGISFYKTAVEAANQRDFNQKKFGAHRIARVVVSAEVGVHVPTPKRPGDSHTTVWPFYGAPEPAIELIEEEGGE